MAPIIDNRNRQTQTCRPVVKPSPLDPYPRNRAGIVRGFVGKKITLSTMDFQRVVRDFNRAGFTLDHVEDMEVPVFEAETGGEVVAWVRALGSGMGQLLNDLPENEQRAWEQDFTAEVERTRTGGLIRLGGVTRLVRARPI